LDEAWEHMMEDIVALSSREYLESIKEARRDYQEGRAVSLEQALER